MNPVIIIPTYNEAQNIEKIILEIEKSLQNQPFSILIVDDNSKDGTVELIEGLNRNNVKILKRAGKLGLASAYIDGIKHSIELGFDTFIQMDADFSHDPKYLPEIFEKLQDYDLVIASRNIKGGAVEGWGFLRNFISKGGSLYSRIVLSCPICDLTGGYNAWKLDLINKIGLDNIISKGYSFQIEMKYRAYLAGAKIVEVPIVFVNRKYGQSKMSKAIFFEALLNILKLRFSCKKAKRAS